MDDAQHLVVGIHTEAIPRVLTISRGDHKALAQLNTYMRMIATFSRLFPPVRDASLFLVELG